LKNTDINHANVDYDIIIIGGGLAGLTSAIHLSLSDFSVLVIEKDKYPKHKVCGEYVSNEVLPYLKSLGVDPRKLGAVSIDQFEMSTRKGKILRTPLPLGGFGISRFVFDQEMAKCAQSRGAHILNDVVTDVSFTNDIFKVETRMNKTFRSAIVIGAYGKRAALDKRLERRFIKNRSPYLAVKTHAAGSFQENLVALHNFKGGYCGVSMIENQQMNLCYITDFKSFKKYKNINDFQQQVLYKNQFLKAIMTEVKPVFENPISISQISFAPKHPVEDHIIMCGDTAGLIHPLCGNGMGMAIRSANIAAQLITKFLRGEIKSRSILERKYQNAWKREFIVRLKTGSIIAALLERDWLAELLVELVSKIPGLLPGIISFTHGKTMTVK